MIKIIKYGTIKITKCPICGCEFSYESEDTKQNYGAWENGPFGETQLIYHSVECPQCKNDVELEATK